MLRSSRIIICFCMCWSLVRASQDSQEDMSWSSKEHLGQNDEEGAVPFLEMLKVRRIEKLQKWVELLLEESKGLRIELKNQLKPEVLTSRNTSIKRSKFKTSDEGLCGCGAQYTMREIGRHYYPRYIPSVICEKKSCWGHSYSCQQKFYRVKVLRLRNHSTHEIADNFLPESLRKDWTFDEISVAVSCECTS